MPDWTRKVHGSPEQAGPIRIGNLCFVSDPAEAGEPESGVIYVQSAPGQAVVEVIGSGQAVTSSNETIGLGDSEVGYRDVFMSDRGHRVLLVDAGSAGAPLRIVGRHGVVDVE